MCSSEIPNKTGEPDGIILKIPEYFGPLEDEDNERKSCDRICSRIIEDNECGFHVHKYVAVLGVHRYVRRTTPLCSKLKT